MESGSIVGAGDWAIESPDTSDSGAGVKIISAGSRSNSPELSEIIPSSITVESGSIFGDAKSVVESPDT